MNAIRRRGLSTALALLLAVESVLVVSAAAAVVVAPHSANHPLPAASPAGEVLAEAGTAARTGEPAAAAVIAGPDTADFAAPHRMVLASASAAATATSATTTSRGSTALTARSTPVAKSTLAAPKPAKATPASTKASQTTAAGAPTSAAAPSAVYTGRNHVWIPALGVDQSVQVFACDRAAAPDNFVYRWGCAGGNNVYLLGHAGGVFRPLHDSYLDGKLQAGLKVYYADDSGTVHVYAVQWWKLTKPTTDASWAWAAQDTPSMTLQTCMGASSQDRLMVRLAQVG